MELLFKEECRFCHDTKIISILDYFDTGDTIKYPDGYEEPSLIYVHNKSTAKKFLKTEGWQYNKGLIFCPKCYENLKNDFVVLDRFKQFYNKEGIHDAPFPSLIMELDVAQKLASVNYNGEIVYFTRAFPIICKFLNGEWQANVVGHLEAHPNQQITISDPE